MSELSTEVIQRFHKDGYMTLNNVLDEELIESLCEQSLKYYRHTIDHIEKYNLRFGIGVKHGYKEIVQRHLNRFEIALDCISKIDFHKVENNFVIKQLPNLIFESTDYHIVNKSTIVSLPGAQDQGWHSDGPHLSLTKHLPCHCFNIFIPLINITPEHGPTEFRPGSQYFTRDMKKLFLPAMLSKKLRSIEGPCLSKGSILVFDYRILHRGTKNITNMERPCLVLTFAKTSYRDILNFPKKSLYDDHNVETMIVHENEEEEKKGEEEVRNAIVT